MIKLEGIINNSEYENINDLDTIEFNNFMEAVNIETERANLPTEEDKNAYRDGLIGLFDPNAENYNNLEETTEKIIEEIDNNHSSPFDKITGDEILAYRFRVSKKIFAAGINLGVSLLIGGVGSAGVRAVIRKYGTKKAINLINRAVVGRLTVWGIKQVVGINFITQLVSTVVRSIFDPGTYIADQVDLRDRRPRNGYIDF